MAVYRKHLNTRQRIVQEAARMFVEEGYTGSSINRLSKNLKLSPGNITFYFPTKEHLLEVLVEENRGHTPLYITVYDENQQYMVTMSASPVHVSKAFYHWLKKKQTVEEVLKYKVKV